MMKKKALVHLHSLLSDVEKRYDEWGIDTDLGSYHDLGVKPEFIHYPKERHKKAIFGLLHGLNNTGRTEQVLERLENDDNNITWETALNKLEHHSKPVNDSEPGYASVELDKTTIDSLGLQPYEKLNKLREEGLITSPQKVAPGTPREEYTPGSTIYLLD